MYCIVFFLSGTNVFLYSASRFSCVPCVPWRQKDSKRKGFEKRSAERCNREQQETVETATTICFRVFFACTCTTPPGLLLVLAEVQFLSIRLSICSFPLSSMPSALNWNASPSRKTNKKSLPFLQRVALGGEKEENGTFIATPSKI